MVQVLVGANGNALRVGDEQDQVQLWIVPTPDARTGGWLILLAPEGLRRGILPGDHRGTTIRGRDRLVSITTTGDQTRIAMRTPSGTLGASITVDSTQLQAAVAQAVRECVGR
jgi:hypothetical protein